MRTRSGDRTRPAGRSAVIWMAALLGAVGGSIAASRFASACSCGPITWTVQLVEVPSEDASVWPTEARLEASGNTLSLTAWNDSAAKIDVVEAGRP